MSTWREESFNKARPGRGAMRRVPPPMAEKPDPVLDTLIAQSLHQSRTRQVETIQPAYNSFSPVGTSVSASSAEQTAAKTLGESMFQILHDRKKTPLLPSKSAPSVTSQITNENSEKNNTQPQDNRLQFKREKISFGIACCRRASNRQIEILLVRKRITYAFNQFVHGRYNAKSTTEMKKLFNNMTIDEKLDILSLKFMQLWYRVWLNCPPNDAFFTAKSKFDSTWAIDNGYRLKKLIASSVSVERMWEIPKGKKKRITEPDLNCAVREFHEETGIGLGSYHLYPYAKRNMSYVDAGCKYTNNYYIAFAPPGRETKIDFGNPDQIAELSGIQWMSIDLIRANDPSGKLEKFIKPIFSFIKKNTK